VNSFVLWLTGLPGSGKTTLAANLERRLVEAGYLVDGLDGDVVRIHLSAELGFSKRDRDTNIDRIAWVASRISRAGAIVIVSAISPYAEARARARETVEENCPFVEVYVSTPLKVCIERDPKGLYRRALKGRLRDFTGISAPYEIPTAADITIDTADSSESESALRVADGLVSLGLLSEEVLLSTTSDLAEVLTA
jgi:adenylyl-sulfate kinase